MRSRFPAMFTFFVLCGSPMLAQADKQTAPPPAAEAITSVYKLSFTIRELVAGKVVSSRSYTSPSAVVNGMFQSGSIRAGDKIPEITAGTQYDYEDVGVKIDFRSLEPVPVFTPHQLGIHVSAERSAAVNGASTTGPNPPMLRHDEWNANFIIEIGKPTLLFSSDDPTLDRTTQVELTAIKIL